MSIKILSFLIFAFFIIKISKCYKYKSKMDTKSWLNETGYPFEDRRVTTEDGYILSLHRIPNPGKPVVLLMHGLIGTSVSYLFQGPKKALGYILYDAGFDVFMGNARGTKYSKRHTHLQKNKTEFWDFSWHEIGVHDISSLIDGALFVTKAKSLSYVGHTQSSTSLLVLLADKPEYNKKIKRAVLMTPITGWTESDFYRKVLDLLLNQMKHLSLKFGIMNQFDTKNWHRMQLNQFCTMKYRQMESICKALKYIAKGYEENHKFLPTSRSNLMTLPIGATLPEFIHYLQIFQSDKFAMYDHGKKNLEIYGSKTPPEYDLSNIKIPLKIYYTSDGYLSPTEEIIKLVEQLSNDVDAYRILESNFTHSDFVWGKLAHVIVYPHILSDLQNKVVTSRPHQHIFHTIELVEDDGDLSTHVEFDWGLGMIKDWFDNIADQAKNTINFFNIFSL